MNLKKLSACAAAAALLLALTACGGEADKEPNYSTLPAITPAPVASEPDETPPASQPGTTQPAWTPAYTEADLTTLRAESARSDLAPFDLSLWLPEGWTAVSANGAALYEIADGLEPLAYLRDEEGDIEGVIGFMPAPDAAEAPEEPMALFAGITLASHHFDCRTAFEPVLWEGGRLLALTDAVHEFSPQAGEEDYAETGILLRDDNAGVCVAIEIDDDVLPAAVLRMAHSLQVSRAD